MGRSEESENKTKQSLREATGNFQNLRKELTIKSRKLSQRNSSVGWAHALHAEVPSSTQTPLRTTGRNLQEQRHKEPVGCSRSGCKVKQLRKLIGNPVSKCKNIYTKIHNVKLSKLNNKETKRMPMRKYTKAYGSSYHMFSQKKVYKLEKIHEMFVILKLSNMMEK